MGLVFGASCLIVELSRTCQVIRGSRTMGALSLPRPSHSLGAPLPARCQQAPVKLYRCGSGLPVRTSNLDAEKAESLRH